ncbi:hypothetical protein [Parenemella sanctibonifatiensis]|uniref:Cellulose synthase n=1 Tax=Parenemella sanctibonifatiensis TaxID=2016505 RepID=A0A255EIH2_9ACTN|nr:hypothetical protein [Parenemella sanctibonifatiensis]OYN91328.1 hypothetical protein CGZ91_07805 [Parenemella sanctibonifatiensis]
MEYPDTVLLPVAIGFVVIGIAASALIWSRSARPIGQILLTLGLSLLPLGLWLIGVLQLLWDGIVALVRFFSDFVITPMVNAGLIVLAVAVVLAVVGPFIAKRQQGRQPKQAKQPKVDKKQDQRQVSAGQASPQGKAGANAGRGSAAPPPQQGGSAGDDFDEIEALLKKRGIE